MSEVESADETLPDEAWKDSFDKLLDQKTALREKQIFTRNVRASFNINSSYENSGYNNTNAALPENKSNNQENRLQIPKTRLHKTINGGKDKCEPISTPVRSSETSVPFKCALSPIGKWEFPLVGKRSKEEEFTKCFGIDKFSATPINQMAVDVDFRESSSTIEKERAELVPTEDSLLTLILKKRKHKYVCFDSNVVSADRTKKATAVLSLQPGKWRKSLNLWRQTKSITSDTNCSRENIDSKGNRYVTKKISITNVAGQRKSTLPHKHSILKTGQNNFKQQLLRRCAQKNILSFDDAYNSHYLENCCKIGEGAFGEVFVYTNPVERGNNKTVLKIIPIEGKELINGEAQKSYEQILQEVVISLELSALKDEHCKSSYASGFVNIERVKCVKGQYPILFQKLWEEYNHKQESENEHPACFTSCQQYIVLEMTFCGEDMEKFEFRNAEQSFYALHQLIYALAVAEDVFQFEHRDLHWGNVLVLETIRKEIEYKLEDKIFTLPTKGVQITIIDYTLSRITYGNCCYYNDLSSDAELFTATGDYQFEIYRMMRNILDDKWESYDAKTNILWISYIISKLLNGVTYKNIRSKLHSKYMKKLTDLHSVILTYKSCMDYVKTLCLTHV